MRAALHVTNGDSTAITLRAASRGGEVLPWRDVLHEGPVPATDAATLRSLRGDFIAARGWAGRTETLAMLAARDERLVAALGSRPVTLWFEHDLYDQLQLLQVLSFVGAELVESELLALVVVDRVAGRPRFRGLGELEAHELVALWPARRALTAADLEAARRGWSAFTASDPAALQAAAHATGPGLPLLPAALRRLLDEYPGARDGLSCTERQILAAVRDAPVTRHEVFLRTQDREAAPFAGDRQIFDHVDGLAAGPRPLLEAQDGRVALTADGERVLAGATDAVALRGVDRWIGGVHVQDGAVWRWDPDTRGLRRDAAGG